MRVKSTQFKFAGALLFVLFVLGADRAKADPLTITFDDAPQGAAAHTLYISQGLVLLSGVTNANGNFAGFYAAFRVGTAGGSNAAFATDLNGDPRWRNLRGSFFHTDAPTPTTTSFLSFNVVGVSPGSLDPWRAVIYGVNNEELEAVTGTGNGSVVFTREMADIAHFVFFAGSTSQGIDNVTFQTATIPEPATLTLFGTGLVGGIASLARRRRRNAVAASN
jgi:hypothetical protein